MVIGGGLQSFLSNFYDLCNIIFHGLNEYMCLIVQGHAIQHNITPYFYGPKSLGQSKMFFLNG
jgi:hypothetical protein